MEDSVKVVNDKKMKEDNGKISSIVGKGKDKIKGLFKKKEKELLKL